MKANRDASQVFDAADRQGPPGPAVLFCPANRPERYSKALDAADAIILDLEDAIGPDDKATARETLRGAAAELPADRTIVRINSPRTAFGPEDVAMLRDSHLRFVMLPKAEHPEEITALHPLSVIATCETALGVHQAYEIAQAPNCVAVSWGGEDLTADIGGWSSRGPVGEYLPHIHYTRSRVLIATAAAGVKAWDTAYLVDIKDLDALAEEAQEAVSMGFAAKIAIHPIQAGVIRDVYQPAPERIDWAERLLVAVRAAGSGVVSFEGAMVDGPLITMAESVVAAADRRK